MIIKFARNLLLTASIGLFTAIVSAEVVVVVHPSNDSALDAKSIQRIFLGKEKKFANGKEAIPVNQDAKAASRNTFDNDTLGRSSAQISAYWSKQVFTGKGIPPKEVANDAAVIELVAANPDTIGYVDSAAVTANVKAISLN